MMRSLSRVASVAALSVLAAAAGASPVLLSQDFDTFSLGNLNGQQGWTSTPVAGAQVVNDAAAQSGARSVSLAANTIIDRSITEANGQAVVWTQSYFRGSGTTSAPNYPADPASAIVHLSATNGIQVLNGNGSGGGAFENTGVALNNPSQWHQILIRQDYTNKTWDCWVNGALEAQDLGFRDNSVDHLGGFRQYAGVACSMDTFLIRRSAVGGDVNFDGVTDAADVVTTANAVSAPPSDPFLLGDVDFDGNGVVENADVQATADVILGL